MTAPETKSSTQPSSNSTMAWALYLTAGTSLSVTDEQLAELDEFELVSRGPPSQVMRYLNQRVSNIAHALICAAGAMPGRSQMLRSVTLLQSILDLTVVNPPLLRHAVRGIATLHLHHCSSNPPLEQYRDTAFLQPLVNIAVDRVSDKELSGAAARCLAVILGCPSFDRRIDDAIPPQICDEADHQTTTLVRLLVSEITSTTSPVPLMALSNLLRRDYARLAFCQRDGASTLASALFTRPGKTHTAIGEVLVTTAASPSPIVSTPVDASYQAVFSVWMLSFAVKTEVREMVLANILSSRLLVVLSRLLDHSSGQRLKIARVTLSSLRNLASGTGVLETRIRRDLISAEVPAVLQKLIRMGCGRGALLGNDEDAMQDAQVLADLLKRERNLMTTLDSYVAEVNAFALHWSPVHTDIDFWVKYAQQIVERHRDVLHALVKIISATQAPPEEVEVACSDLCYIMQESRSGKAALVSIEGFKETLMRLMTTHPSSKVRAATLSCVQRLLITNAKLL